MASPVGDSEGEAAAAKRGGRSLALAVLCVVLFLTFLDNTVVSVALGSVQSTLHAGVSSLQWVVSAYTISFAACILTAGALGDRLGAKPIFMTGFGIFTAASLMCGLSNSLGQLVFWRLIQGLGGGGLIATSQAILMSCQRSR